MNGIDISSYQKTIDLGKVPFDFCIIKATEGTTLVQPTCAPWVQQCIQMGKPWGFYHFCAGGDPVKEADWFVDNTEAYFGHGIPALDYEDYGRFGTDKAKQFLDRVYDRTGVRCMVYTSRSVLKEEDWSKIAPNHALWVAQYANYDPTGYQENPWIQEGTFGAWAAPTIHQYSSSGKLSGYSGNLDLDKAYITAEQWAAIAAGDKVDIKPSTPGGSSGGSGGTTSKPGTGGTSGGTIVKGSVVRVKQGAKDYNGGGLASYVYTRDHVVSEVSGDRCVITYNGAVVAAIRKSDLTLVSGGSSGSSGTSTSKPSTGGTIVKGSVVRVKSGAKTYEGGGLASYVYSRDHVVSEVSGDRCVITYGGVVVAAVKKSDLTLVSGGGSSGTSKPSTSTTKAVQKGSKVKVKQGAKDYNGNGLASFVYTRTHVVSEMSGNRCVITYNGVVVAAVHKDNLTVV